MNDKYLDYIDGHFVVKMDQPLEIIDFHIHMSNVLPGKQVSPEKIEEPLKYPTLPPMEAMDLDIPYWTKIDYLNNKYKSSFALLGYAKEGYTIFKDMLKGTYNNYFQSAKENHIVKSVVLPISTKNSDQSMNALQNARSYSDFIPFMSIHPKDPNGLDKVSKYLTGGAKGLKLKLTINEMEKHYNELLRLMDKCYEYDIPVLFHTGAILENQNSTSKSSKKLLNITRVEMFERLLEDMPSDFKFVFGHAGIQSYKKVAEMMIKHPGSYAELSCQSTDSIKYLISKVGSQRLLFGSDWPALPQAITLSRVLHATEDNDNDRKNILFNNAKKLLKL